MNGVSLILATYNPNISMINQALKEVDLFDEVILHVNHKELPQGIVKLFSKKKDVLLKRR
jgi:hypothetical protein